MCVGVVLSLPDTYIPYITYCFINKYYLCVLPSVGNEICHPCSANSDCNGQFSVCREGRCVCNDNYVEVNGECCRFMQLQIQFLLFDDIIRSHIVYMKYCISIFLKRYNKSEHVLFRQPVNTNLSQIREQIKHNKHQFVNKSKTPNI